ncbi:MAG: pyrimidine 5-nucleotidase [Chloroflexota bacterium]|nr:pyrimidine 5-nucleotidase [Chloroflexota bacterium]
MQPITPESPIQGIIFDFGSTLSITRVAWPVIITEGATAVSAWLRQAGLTLPDDFPRQWAAALRFSIQRAEEDGREQSAETLLAQLLAAQGHVGLSADQLVAATDRYFAVEDGLRQPATGATALLAALKGAGYRVGILSNTFGGRWVQRWTDTHGFRPYVDTVVTSDALGIRKPRPEIFLATLARLGLNDPGRAVMVGDTLAHDIAGAQPLGLRTVWVTLAEDQGFTAQGEDGRRAALARPPAAATVKPDAQISALADLIPLLERWQDDGG